MNLRVHHVALHTPDRKRLRSFYQDAFGFEFVFEKHFDKVPLITDMTGVPGASAHVITLKSGNCFIEIFEWTAPKGRPLEPLRPYDFGYTHFAVEVDDIEVSFKRLSELGMRFVHPSAPRITLDGAVYGSVYGFDPDGNIIELMEVPRGDALDLGD